MSILIIVISFSNFGQTIADTTETLRFEKNKGQLIIPADKYISAEKCCVDQNYKGNIVSTAEPLVNIIKVACDSTSNAIAVAEGVVYKILHITNFKMVIIKHGEYFTIYSNLESVSLRQGHRVSEEQKIGSIKTTDSATILYFEIWYKMRKIDPLGWLKLL
nr:M23 family metallopeptidase [uncultured Brumimicrobium sp.]